MSVILVIVDEGQPTSGPASFHDLSDGIVVGESLASVAGSEIADEQAKDDKNGQANSRENAGDSSLVTEEGRSTTALTSRNEGGVANDSGNRHRVSTGICNDHGGGDHRRNVGDGVSLLVGGRQIDGGV